MYDAGYKINLVCLRDGDISKGRENLDDLQFSDVSLTMLKVIVLGHKHLRDALSKDTVTQDGIALV